MKPIIQRAQADAGGPDEPSDLDAFLRQLFQEPETTIDEVYDASVAFAVEADRLAEQAKALPAQFRRLLNVAGGGEPEEDVLAVITETRDALSALLREYER